MRIMNPAPVALFVYNRPDHTKKTITALLKNPLSATSDLIIYADGAKNEQAIDKVLEVRSYISTIEGFKSVQITERDKNYGLAKSIISGVTEVVNRHGKIIVLEDDLVTSPYFLTFMNKALDLYKEDEDVISIHAYNYPIKSRTPETSFFLKGADCWGWATWKRGWDLFEKNGNILLEELKTKGLISEFDFNDSYPYSKMLEDQITGKNDSWAIRWYASAFLKDKYTLYPTQSLVMNIGLDLSGTHSGSDPQYNTEQLYSGSAQELKRITVEENIKLKKAIEAFFRKQTRPSFKDKIVKWILKKW